MYTEASKLEVLFTGGITDMIHLLTNDPRPALFDALLPHVWSYVCTTMPFLVVKCGLMISQILSLFL
jgi:hypothetical protein